MRERLKKLTPNWMKACYRKTRYLAITAFFLLARILPIRRKLVVLCNVWGYGDNCKYVAEALLAKKLEIVFITNHPEQVPEGMTALKTNSLKALTALARAKVWVECNRKEAYIKKRKGQYYIQLWHGGIALKKIEGDCAAELGEKYIKRAKKDSAMTDLFVSNSTICTQMYKRAFWANCEIMEVGSPRNDAFVRMQGQRNNAEVTHNKERAHEAELAGKAWNQDKIENNRQRENRQHIAIYAPTYRNIGGMGQEPEYFDFDAARLKEVLSKRFGGNWEILVRLHPMVAAQSKGKYAGAVDISDKPDLYEYLYQADVLITDYSNTMFEFAMAEKPVFLCAGDAEEYAAERGLYFNYESLPYPKATNCVELCEQILSYDEERWGIVQKEFLETLGMRETGNAAEAVAERIQEVVKQQ